MCPLFYILPAEAESAARGDPWRRWW